MSEWVKDNVSYYYYYSDGTMATGWQELEGYWYYFYSDGSMAWDTMVEGCYVNTDGQWTKDEGSRKITDNDGNDFWYYVGPEGKAVTGWNKIGDNFHYYNYPGGSMTYENTIDGFQIDEDGNIVSGTGWIQDEYSGNWYYFSEGSMATGWIQDGDNWYYLNDDGEMATGWKNINGDWYYFHSDGTMATGWVNDGTGWYYLYGDGNGSMAWGKTVDGYLLDNGGKMVTGTGWKSLNGDWYYLNNDKEATGWLKDGDNWYYLYGDNGSMAWGTTIDGYHLNNDGQWVVNSDDDEINSLPEYDPLTARLTENKGTRVKKKGVNGEYFAGTIDEFGNFVPDDIEGFTNIKIDNDPTSTGSRAGGFIGGVLDSASNQIEGALNIIRHPVDTAESLERLATDSDYRKQAASSIVGGIHDSYENEVTNGNPSTEAYFWGEAAGEIGTLFLTDGAGEGAKEEEMVSASSYIKGAGNAETFSFNSPAARHSYSKITQKSVAKDANTVIMPGVDVSADVQAINAGKAIREGNNFTINGRTYGMHDGTLYPISGEGLVTLDRGGYKALGVYKKFGETPQAETILNNMGVSAETRSQALNVYKTAEGIN